MSIAVSTHKIRTALQELDKLMKDFQKETKTPNKPEGPRSVTQSRELVHKLQEVLLAELQAVDNIEELKKRPGFVQKLARLVLLTCCEKSSTRNGDVTLYADLASLHEQFYEIFNSLVEVTKIRSDSCGKPVLWKLAPPDSHSQEASGSLWKHLHAFAEIPAFYSEDSCLAPIMYLLTTEASKSFHLAPSIGAEIPSLADLYAISEKNDRKAIRSLIEELHALVCVCLWEQYTDHTVVSIEQKYDFAIKDKRGKTVRKVSVKTVRFKGQKTNRTLSSFLAGQNEATVLLHDCDCPFCDGQPLCKVVLQSDQISDYPSVSTAAEEPGAKLLKTLSSFNCNRKKEFVELLKGGKLGTVYLLCARLLYDLRDVLCDFDQRFCRESTFHLRDHLRKMLDSANSKLSVGQPIPALILRS